MSFKLHPTAVQGYLRNPDLNPVPKSCSTSTHSKARSGSNGEAPPISSHPNLQPSSSSHISSSSSHRQVASALLISSHSKLLSLRSKRHEVSLAQIQTPHRRRSETKLPPAFNLTAGERKRYHRRRTKMSSHYV